MGCGCVGAIELVEPWWVRWRKNILPILAMRMLGSKVAVSCGDAPTLNNVTAADLSIATCGSTGWRVRGTVTLSAGLPPGFEIAWYFGSSTVAGPSTSFIAADTNLTRDFDVGDIGSDDQGFGTATIFAKVGAEIRIISDSTVCDGKDDSTDASKNDFKCFA